jgi:hypothetical protein
MADRENSVMTVAGKEPAEDVKRALRRAIKLAGLEVDEIRMFKSPPLDGRIVLATASPDGWRHNTPAIRAKRPRSFPEELPRSLVVLACLKHGTPLPPELWRTPIFDLVASGGDVGNETPGDATQEAGSTY